jgi:hypothetical protein
MTVAEFLVALLVLASAAVGGAGTLGEDRVGVLAAAAVQTDGWRGYCDLGELGYRHEAICGTDEVGEHPLPHCHRVAALLQRWLLETHQGAVRPSRLDYYLDEFTFRFNRRTSRSRGKRLYRLAQQAVAADPVPESALRGKKPERRAPQTST